MAEMFFKSNFYALYIFSVRTSGFQGLFMFRGIIKHREKARERLREREREREREKEREIIEKNREG